MSQALLVIIKRKSFDGDKGKKQLFSLDARPQFLFLFFLKSYKISSIDDRRKYQSSPDISYLVLYGLA